MRNKKSEILINLTFLTVTGEHRNTYIHASKYEGCKMLSLWNFSAAVLAYTLCMNIAQFLSAQNVYI